jgi:hypothetical protein
MRTGPRSYHDASVQNRCPLEIAETGVPKHRFIVSCAGAMNTNADKGLKHAEQGFDDTSFMH